TVAALAICLWLAWRERGILRNATEAALLAWAAALGALLAFVGILWTGMPLPLVSRSACLFSRRRHAPDHVAPSLRHHGRHLPVHRDADRTALRLAVLVEKTGEQLDRFPGWFPLPERHVDHVVARQRPAVPGTVLADD